MRIQYRQLTLSQVTLRFGLRLILGMMLLLAHMPKATADAPETAMPSPVVFDSVDDLALYFDQRGYHLDQIGDDQVTAPRLILEDIPAGWFDDVAIPVKKSVFFRSVLPLILQENQLLVDQRSRLENLPVTETIALKAKDFAWLQALARRYQIQLDVAATGEDGLTDSVREELLRRVDAIPVSLALAQAALESGWAGSRFACEGNALFGQWTRGGMIPREQREDKTAFGVASFDSPADSVRGYFNNLNTHAAYANFRAMRTQLRRDYPTRPLSGPILAQEMSSYSEEGQDYVEKIQSMIRGNQLDELDDARLAPGEPVFFRPSERLVKTTVTSDSASVKSD